jgi:molybdate transport system substrate-binding protein
MVTRYLILGLLTVCALVVFAACASDDDSTTDADDSAVTETTDDASVDDADEVEDDADATDETDDASIDGELMIYTAGSLTAAFEDMKSELESTYPDLEVTLNIGNSAALRTQLEEGGQADVYASANIAQMDLAQEADRIEGEPLMFARNRLILIVPADNPAGIEAVADLAEPDTMVVLAQEQVPVGAYARDSLDLMSEDPELGEDFKDRVMENVVSEEQTVMAVVTKIQLGEADAGIVFASELDDELLDEVQVIEIPDQFNVIAEYPAAMVEGAPNPEAAEMFLDYLLGEEGQSILEGHGFMPYDE